MPLDCAFLPTLTQTSSQTAVTSTGTNTVSFWDVSDAANVAVICNSNTTAPGPFVTVSFTSSAGSTFTPLLTPSGLTSAMTAFNVSSSGCYLLSNVSWKIMSFGTSGVMTTGISYTGMKQFSA